jgi:hypothetical protein
MQKDSENEDVLEKMVCAGILLTLAQKQPQLAVLKRTPVEHPLQQSEDLRQLKQQIQEWNELMQSRETLPFLKLVQKLQQQYGWQKAYFSRLNARIQQQDEALRQLKQQQRVTPSPHLQRLEVLQVEHLMQQSVFQRMEDTARQQSQALQQLSDEYEKMKKLGASM